MSDSAKHGVLPSDDKLLEALERVGESLDCASRIYSALLGVQKTVCSETMTEARK